MLLLTFEINLKSNYHIGAGYGKGFNLDSALLREAGGRAIIRGTMLTGLLRDGARRKK
jgi:CRISPR-associated protein Csx10